MLTIGKKWIKENVNETVKVNMFGQEKNGHTYSICKSDFLITGEQPENIKRWSTLSRDGFQDANRKFDYMICNPPYGSGVGKKMRSLLKTNQKTQLEDFLLEHQEYQMDNFFFFNT